MRRALASFIALAALAGCSGSGGVADPPRKVDAPELPALAGPHANAGADQMALEGAFVTLDGRASQLGDDRRVPAVRWTQVVGDPVVLEDPTSPTTRFLAPRAGGSSQPLVFELNLDDGSHVTRDRVNVFVTPDAAEIRPAVVLLGGEDQRVTPGASFELPVRALRFGCEDAEPGDARICGLGEDGKPRTGPDAADVGYPYCLEQVEGPAVEIPAGFACDREALPSGAAHLEAPAGTGLLIFKVDARPQFDFVEPPVLRFANKVRPAPDFVRVWVSPVEKHKTCVARIYRDGLRVKGLDNVADASRGAALWLTGSVDCDGAYGLSRTNTYRYSVFRPLQGAPLIEPPVDGDAGSLTQFPDALVGRSPKPRVEIPAPPWTRYAAITFEFLSLDGLWSAPEVVAFRQDTGGSDLVARLPPVSCSVVPPFSCTPQAPVVLDGSESTAGAGLRYCWTQNLGPPTSGAELPLLEEKCFPAPKGLQRILELPAPAEQDPSPRTYAFQLLVERVLLDEHGNVVLDGADHEVVVARGLPDTTLFNQQPPDNRPPVAGTDGSDTVGRELDTVFLDGRCSNDPDEGPAAGATCGRTLLQHYHWSQITEPGVPPVIKLEAVPCPMTGVPPITFPLETCARATIPRVLHDSFFRFQLQVEDKKTGVGTAELRVRVFDKLNEPPVAVALVRTPLGRTSDGAIIVRGNTDVVLDPRGSYDPNTRYDPSTGKTGRDHLRSCRWTYNSNIDPLEDAECDPFDPKHERGCLAHRLPPEPSDLGACAGDRFRFHVPLVGNAPNRFTHYDFTLHVDDDPPCLFSEGGCLDGQDKPMSNTRTVSVIAIRDDEGPWVDGSADPALSVGYRDFPFTTLQDALALARDPELDFKVIHVREGTYDIADAATERLLLGGRTIIGEPGSGTGRVVIYTAQGIALQDGAGLQRLDVRLRGGGREAIAVLQGSVALDDVRASVESSTRDPAYAVHVDGAAELDIRDSAAQGRVSEAQGGSTGLYCEQGVVNAWRSTFSGGGGPGLHRGLFLAAGCTADIRDSVLRGVDPGQLARNRPGSKDGVAIGLESASVLDVPGRPPVWLRALEGTCTVQGGRASEVSVGARVLRAQLDDCALEGGVATIRTGLEATAPGQSVCQGEDCVVVNRGSITGGTGNQAGGESRGVWAHGGVDLLGVTSVLGETGAESDGKGKAWGLAMEHGGIVSGVATISGGGPARSAFGIESSGKPLLLEESDVLGGHDVTLRAIGLSAQAEVQLSRGNRIRAIPGQPLPSFTQAVLVGDGGALLQLQGDTAFGALIDGGGAVTSAVGISAAGVVRLDNFRVLAGPAPSVTVMETRGTTLLGSGMLRGRPGNDDVVVLSVLGGAPELRNVILDVGGTQSRSRSHVRVASPFTLPPVMRAVLFAFDPLCDASGGYLAWSGGKACDATTIKALGAEQPFVLDPRYVDAGAEDFHLADGSGAVDAGLPEQVPPVDADGVTRPQGSGPDIGPYER